MLVFKIQPSEFWGMTPGEWWVIHDLHHEQMGAIRKTGKQSLTKAEALDLKRELNEAIEKERREHGRDAKN